jgi:predicted nuclease of predicted toxin-antitoxin system
MKVLLDSCVCGGACAVLKAAGHDAVWTGDWPRDPGDEEILAHAYKQGRVLVTLDKDFGELAVLRGIPHKGILRLVNISSRQQAAVTMQILDAHESELTAGAIITAEPGRLRIRMKSD